MTKQIILLFITLSLSTNLLSEETVILKNGKKAILYDDHTWTEVTNNQLSSDAIIQKNKQYLRTGITASSQDILIACEMYEQGWSYTMPQPKSSKAGWGITDGRTTWYNGWWYNVKTGLYSDTTPQKASSGLYLGDNQNNSNTWRKGGSPGRPDIYMYLLSKSGGPR